MDREEIDQKYIGEAAQLEAEFFDIVDEGKPSQHRVLKEGQSINEFDAKHTEIWRNHEAELIAEGFIQPTLEPEPTRDLAAEIDDLRARIEELENR